MKRCGERERRHSRSNLHERQASCQLIGPESLQPLLHTLANQDVSHMGVQRKRERADGRIRDEVGNLICVGKWCPLVVLRRYNTCHTAALPAYFDI